MGKYRSFEQMIRHERAGVDFDVRYRPGPSGILVMAPHGGAIEPGTTQIAEALAGGAHGFYTFEGLRPNANSDLHMTSTCFDEPTALRAVRKHRTVVTVHGCKGRDPFVQLGGRDTRIKERLREAMESRGIRVTQDPRLPGLHVRNLCNRGLTGMGIQLEVSAGLRRAMFDGPAQGARVRPTKIFHQFLAAVGGVLDAL